MQKNSGKITDGKRVGFLPFTAQIPQEYFAHPLVKPAKIWYNKRVCYRIKRKC